MNCVTSLLQNGRFACNIFHEKSLLSSLLYSTFTASLQLTHTAVTDTLTFSTDTPLASIGSLTLLSQPLYDILRASKSTLYTNFKASTHTVTTSTSKLMASTSTLLMAYILVHSILQALPHGFHTFSRVLQQSHSLCWFSHDLYCHFHSFYLHSYSFYWLFHGRPARPRSTYIGILIASKALIPLLQQSSLHFHSLQAVLCPLYCSMFMSSLTLLHTVKASRGLSNTLTVSTSHFKASCILTVLISCLIVSTTTLSCLYKHTNGL